jgi:hypothetical protein
MCLITFFWGGWMDMAMDISRINGHIRVEFMISFLLSPKNIPEWLKTQM